MSLSAGVPAEHARLVHPVNFNDLASVEWVCERHAIAALIVEPILQNIGIVKPEPGYLKGLRRLADRFHFVLIFDEVKTGFRHGLGGYSQICGVTPDLVVMGKALANGYPIAALGGKKEIMDLFVHPDASKRVFLAGTYNAHPVPTAAAIATIERLSRNEGEVYRHVDELGRLLEEGVKSITCKLGIDATLARQGSACCLYFMGHQPVDWHDLALHHNATFDEQMRQGLIERGIYVFPLQCKQWSISFAHREADIETTLRQLEDSLAVCSK